MKALLIALLLLASLTINAQVTTTQEEYNYLIKGYKSQLELGQDMKKGYVLDNSPGGVQNGDYNFEFKPLIREETKEIAAILVIANSKAWGNNTYYFCIPRNNATLTQQYVIDLRKLDTVMLRAYAEVCSMILPDYFAVKK